MGAKVPATIVTGFLGAGKTTLIRHLLAHAGGRRIALVINEFGELGVDGEILRACGVEACRDEDIVELANGCLCCTVADDFVPTLGRLLDRAAPPEHVVIETSGLALPQPLVRAFNWPGIRERMTVDGVVTVVDAEAHEAGRFAPDPAALAAQRAADPTLDHETPVAELFGDQIGCADLIVVNKADLAADPEAVARAVAAEARPGARVVRSVQGAVPPGILLGLGIGTEADIDRRLTHHERAGEAEHEHDDFESFVVALPEVETPAALAGRVGAAIRGHGILRVKGFAAVAAKPMRLLLQAVGPRIETRYDRPWRPGEARETRLVVIGERGLDRAVIAAALGGR